MKTKFYLLLIFSVFTCQVFSQTDLKITVLTDNQIIGSGTPNATLHLKPSSAVAVIDNTIPANGLFNFTLAGLTAGEDAIIWETSNGKDSDKIVKPILTNSQMIIVLSNPSTTTDLAKKNYSISEKLMSDNLLMKSTIATYKKVILNTNFTIPVARFDINKPQYDSSGALIGDTKGSISLFSSFGFGVGVCGGRAEVTRDSNGLVIDESFANTFGVYLGVLYQASTGENEKNVFAPTLSLSILDIQIGIGYDYGKVPVTQERTFVTVSYGIPLFKLFKTNHRVWLDTNDTPFLVKKI